VPAQQAEHRVVFWYVSGQHALGLRAHVTLENHDRDDVKTTPSSVYYGAVSNQFGEFRYMSPSCEYVVVMQRPEHASCIPRSPPIDWPLNP
jgi:hypothetical protein